MASKTVMIAGLSLGGNKGGPALLASLAALLRANLPGARIVMLSTALENDRRWQDRYQVELVKRPSPSALLQQMSIYRGADLVIDMHGVKFSGKLSVASAAVAALPLVAPKLRGISTVSFTQTYGPFESAASRLAAQFSLRAANLLYVREPQSAAILDSIGLTGKYTLYPDVAITLPCDPLEQIPISDAARRFIEQPFIGMSISKKVVREELRKKLPARYRPLMTDLMRWLLDKGQRLLLVPHVYTPYAPKDNDYELIEQVYGELKGQYPPDQLHMLTEDLPPEALKTIISRAHIFIGSRYHSLVASLSTGVPSISVGWSHKYQGLLGLFGMERYATWAERVTEAELRALVEELLNQRESLAAQMQSRLPEAQARVGESVRRIAELIR
jgi:polysaccharide pyruvyl transferase WcaK-like protein